MHIYACVTDQHNEKQCTVTLCAEILSVSRRVTTERAGSADSHLMAGCCCAGGWRAETWSADGAEHTGSAPSAFYGVPDEIRQLGRGGSWRGGGTDAISGTVVAPECERFVTHPPTTGIWLARKLSLFDIPTL